MQTVVVSVCKEAESVVASVRTGDRQCGASKILPNFDKENETSLRWILEDFPRLASDSAKTPALMAESRLQFFTSQISELLSEPLSLAIGETPLDKIAFTVDDPDGNTRHWPWELLTWNETPLVLSCLTFSRSVGQVPSRLSVTPPTKPLKLLIVVARPRGVDDVAFRSVASRVIAATSDDAIVVEILRPPTFNALRNCLLTAHQDDDPYDIVHFDGHGSLIETEEGRRGVLVFEDESATAADYIRGTQIGALLAEADVSLFVLNACHSGAAPINEPSDERPASSSTIASASLAEEVAGSGPIDVVSMSHAVYVSTAVHIIEDLYRCLNNGHSLGAAVSFARRRWTESEVGRSSALGYCIIRHFGCCTDANEVDSWPQYGALGKSDDRTPHHPDMQAAFHTDNPYVAADSSILVLERALRRAAIVQLNGMRGSGKTALLLELGRWLAASVAVDPRLVAYIDLNTSGDIDDFFKTVKERDAAILLIDHADCVHGDPLRNVDAWPFDKRDAFVEFLTQESDAGKQVLLAASAPVKLNDDTERVVMSRLNTEDIRALIELQADLETAQAIPEPALRWTAGNPGVVPVLVNLKQAGALADATHTLEAVRELGLGRFVSTKPPLAQITALHLTGSALLYEPDVGLPWLIMQFQGQAILSPLLWEIATATGFSSLGRGDSRNALPTLLENLEKSGLILPLGNNNFHVHPLLSSLIGSPYNTEQLSTEGYYRSLMKVQGLYCKYTQMLHSLPFDAAPDVSASSQGWDLQGILHAFSCVTGELQVEPMGALSFARRLRSHFLDLGLTDFWAAVLKRLTDVFEKYPPGQDDGQFNPNSEFLLLKMEEATRLGDEELAAEYSKQAIAAMVSIPDLGNGAPQVNAYDVNLKSGRQLLASDKTAALDAFKAALGYAGSDPIREANAKLELTRLLRQMGSPQHLIEARIYGESALAINLKLLKAKLRNEDDLALITMSLSLVYKALLEIENPDPFWAQRGEELCRESLRRAEQPSQQATAWFNLGGWRRRARDYKEAAGAFLEAESLYEELDEQTMLAYTLTYSGHALYECGEFLQARLNTVRAVEIMVQLPNKPKTMIRYAYDIAEAAWAKFNSGSEE